ncbi:MAG TPA: OmpA family protein [Polyangiaceae bacterium]|nr:OmpA family protein [Polyangiaceae bacterium]
MSRLFFPLGALALVAACGSDPPPPPKAPPAPAPVAAAPLPEKPGDVPTRSNIAISDDIKKACGITDSDAYFAYDSANVRPQDQAILHKLAACFSTGPLKGHTMRLVGHADPRGDEEYNMVLAGRRADNVKMAINGAGLDNSRMATTSRGELDATGTDEAGWEKDRRVDIMLGS